MAGSRRESSAELTLDCGLEVVPEARRFAEAALAERGTERAGDLVSDTEFVVTELVTNAALHGEPPIVLRIDASPQRVRVEVADAGLALPVQVTQRPDAMTGRGLSFVAALSSRWGVAPRRPGKVVWAELTSGPERTLWRVAPEIDRDAILDAWPDRDGEPAPRFGVRLPAVPTALLLAAKSHIDNVVREMSLLQGGSASKSEQLPESVKRLIEAVTVDFAEARTEIKRQALDAASQGIQLVDLELRLPASAAGAGERYLAALDEADRYARSARLLTLAAPTSHRVLRRWYVRSIVHQLRALARGDTPAETEPFALALAAEVDRLARLKGAASRAGIPTY
jgi:anti-sigma regulatory factor (Ser/Thr protein kinase)